MRHAGGAPNAAALQAAASAKKAAEKAAAAPKKTGVRGVADARFLEVLDEVGVMLREGRWEQATGIHFVALYADLHFRVYGIVAGDLGKKERVFAAKLATDMIRDDFAGSREDFAKFVAWTWSRERSREQWRRENKRPGGRVSWRLQFGKALLTEYRIEAARKAAAR